MKDNSGIQTVLTEKFDHARKLAIITARSINSLIEWSMVEILVQVGTSLEGVRGTLFISISAKKKHKSCKT